MKSASEMLLTISEQLKKDRAFRLARAEQELMDCQFERMHFENGYAAGLLRAVVSIEAIEVVIRMNEKREQELKNQDNESN